ncbi:hypothetical protein PUR28_00635, partial [Streptomyces sp. BE308]
MGLEFSGVLFRLVIAARATGPVLQTLNRTTGSPTTVFITTRPTAVVTTETSARATATVVIATETTTGSATAVVIATETTAGATATVVVAAEAAAGGA